jgi:hypothetical protein
MQKMQDPVMQAQMQELQLKQADLQRKSKKDEADAMLNLGRLTLDAERIKAQERTAGVTAGIKAAATKEASDHKYEEAIQRMRLEGIKVGNDMMKNRFE